MKKRKWVQLSFDFSDTEEESGEVPLERGEIDLINIDLVSCQSLRIETEEE